MRSCRLVGKTSIADNTEGEGFSDTRNQQASKTYSWPSIAAEKRAIGADRCIS